ncbi:MAG: PQQ-binding-like beta-propeller repeat protein, partial [Methanoregula sp.]|nr:PQQ-binding-like beta-propeller repeat protein [Methanoregula sp.]
HDWINTGSSSTTFGTAGIPTGFTDATLNNVALSSADSTYTFNGVSQAGANPVAPINYYENHTWSVTGAVNPAANSVFQYALGTGSSFKTTLAALAVKYPGATTVAPVASFTANIISGTAPLTVNFTDTSSNSPTSWAWDFTNDGIIDATTQNATYTYASAGTYTVNLTVANTAGSNTSVQIGFVTVTSAAGTGGLADSAWPKFQGDANNTGQSLYNGPGTNNSIWSYTTSSKGYVYSSPVIGADGMVYIGSADRKLYALRANGTLNWSYTTGNIISGAPAVASDGTIYIGGRDSKLYALRADGTLKWSYTFGSQVWGSPVIGDNGVIYIGSRDKNLYALNPDGSLKWSYITAGEIRGSPAMKADGTIFIGSGDKNLYAVNSDGTLKWSYTTGNTVYGSPAIGNDGTIYVGSSDKNLYAVNPNGTLKWTYTTGNSIEGSPAIRADGTICIGSSDAKVYAINPDGTLRWSYTTGNGITGSPAVGADGILYIGSKDARVYALNPDGSLRWTSTTGSAIVGSPAIGADSVLYIGSNDCKVYAFKDVTPVANFTSTVISGTEGYIPLTVQFTDSSSNIPTTWFWYFGDGTTSTEQNPSHTFTLPGTYSVNLTVKNAAGSGSITKTDYINVATPSSATAEFAADTTTGLAPLTVYFTGEPVGIVTTWAWDFDNNGIIDATTQNASYQYPSPGTYTVNLTVTNAVGSKTILKTDYIVVTGALPAADFTADPTNGKAALTVHFNDISTGSISGWAWDFNNDGLTDASTQNPTHTYTKAGNYSVNLTVYGPMGSNSTVKTDLISVISNIDLTVSTISPLIFSHFTQSPISATIRNSGTENATAFNVTFSIDGKNTTILVSGLGAGAINSFSITDTEDRTSGASVPITVTVDHDNRIGEINETNNGLTTSTTVIANGYAGHRWSDCPDLTTKKTYLLHGDTIGSLCDSQY